MKHKLKILVLLTDAFGRQGGIAKFNRDLLTALCSFPEVERVAAIPRLTANPGPLPDRLVYVNSGSKGKLKYFFTVLQALLRSPKFDLVFCGHINLLPLAWMAALFCRAPFVLITHGIEAWKPTGRLFVNFLVKKIDASIAVSDFTRQKFVSWAHPDGKPSFILPNAVDLERFKPGPKNQELLKRCGLEGKKVLMTLARLDARERYKGIDEVLEILAELAQEVPSITYLIAGDGTDRKRLEEKAKNLGVADRVFFTGFVPESEKADYYRLADVFVMPGRGEGFGIAYLEALACGVPVVGSKLDASREALKNGELGLLVDPENREEIKAAILKALANFSRQVPPGLNDFSYLKFKDRLSKILHSLYPIVGAGLKPALTRFSEQK